MTAAVAACRARKYSCTVLPRSVSERRQTRAFYGWFVLLVAAAAMVGTLPGRTQGLGLITEPLIADLGIDRVTYAGLNFWATILGSTAALAMGHAIDRFGTRNVLTMTAVLLGLVVCAMSGTRTAAELAIWLTLTRALGQSALSVVSLAMVGHWFVRRIDGAMAIYSIVMSIGFMIAFPTVGAVVQIWGWRAAWLAIGCGLDPCARTARVGGCSPQSRVDRLGAGRGARRRSVQSGSRGDCGCDDRLSVAVRNRHPGVLGVCHRRRALWARRVGHRALQRIDPGGARLRSGRVLPDAGRHRDYRAGGELLRGLARAAPVADAAACRIADHPGVGRSGAAVRRRWRR